VYKGEHIAQGREKAKAFFERETAVAEEVEKLIRERLMQESAVLAVAEAESELMQEDNYVEE
jgi:hypothetical protein